MFKIELTFSGVNKLISSPEFSKFKEAALSVSSFRSWIKIKIYLNCYKWHPKISRIIILITSRLFLRSVRSTIACSTKHTTELSSLNSSICALSPTNSRSIMSRTCKKYLSIIAFINISHESCKLYVFPHTCRFYYTIEYKTCKWFDMLSHWSNGNSFYYNFELII